MTPWFFNLTAEEVIAQSPIPVTALVDEEAVHAQLARTIADELAINNAAGNPTRLILPVGPTLQYPILAQITNAERISWRNAHLFFMDEYCDWQGRRVPADHPLSFVGAAHSLLLNQLDAALAPPSEQVIFPDPRNLDHVAARIAEVGGIDTCYGGVGIHGHVAFNEAPISRWYTVTPAEFKASTTRLLQLAEETVVMNGSRSAGGYFPALPPMAVTLGMAEIYGARRVRLYCQRGTWQRAILRIALFGSPDTGSPDTGGEDVRYPVTLLRDHADIQFVADWATLQPPY